MTVSEHAIQGFLFMIPTMTISAAIGCGWAEYCIRRDRRADESRR